MNIKRARLLWFECLVVVQWILTLIPAMTLLTLGLMTWRGYCLLGRLPIPLIDNPKFIEDGLFQGLYLLTLSLLSLFDPLVWVLLIAVVLRLHYRFNRQLLRTIFYGLLRIAVYTLPWLIMVQDPTQRMTWLFD